MARVDLACEDEHDRQVAARTLALMGDAVGSKGSHSSPGVAMCRQRYVLVSRATTEFPAHAALMRVSGGCCAEWRRNPTPSTEVAA